MPFYTIDFEASTGADWSDCFELRDSSDGVPAFDLVGAVFTMIAKGPDGSFDVNVTVVDAFARTIAVGLPHAIMAGKAPGLYSHECTMSQGGQVLDFWTGKLVVTQSLAA